MKILATVLAFMCIGIVAYGQNENLELALKQKSNEPTSKIEHFYLLQLKNNSNKTTTINLAANNTRCSDIGNRAQTELTQTFLDKRKASRLSNLTIPPNGVSEFYVKINRRKNTTLNTWNCTEIVATSIKDKANSNSIVIKSFIPDPKDFN